MGNSSRLRAATAAALYATCGVLAPNLFLELFGVDVRGYGGVLLLVAAVIAAASALVEYRRAGVVEDEPLPERDHSPTALHYQAQLEQANSRVEHYRAQAASAAEGLSSVVEAMTELEQSVRGQIVAELHDTVAQMLLAARYTQEMDDKGKDDVLEIVDEAEQALRDVMAAHRPPQLRSATLLQATHDLLRTVATKKGVDYSMDWHSTATTIPQSHALVIYRFVQESAHNAVRHSGSDTIAITLSASPASITVTVADTGRGFDPTAVRSSSGRHIGMDLMRRRANALQGSVTVTSAPGQGSDITLRLPLAPP